MSWFRTSKKTKKPAKPRRTATTMPASTWDPRRTLWMLRVGGWVATLAALGAAWHFGEGYLKQHVGERRLVQPHVVLDNLPGWVSPALADQLYIAAGSALSGNPLDQRSLAAVAESLEANPWVEQVYRVARGNAGQVVVFAQYRQPVAVVETSQGYHLVDPTGRKLPGVYKYGQLKALSLPVITGVASSAPADGQPWPGHDVAAGLSLITYLAGQPFSDQIAAVDVTNHDGRRDRARPHLYLVTRNGAVRWGRAPGEPHERVYEPDPQKKLRHLLAVQQKFGSIDAGGNIVDVFTDQVLIHPAAQARRISYTRAGD